MSNKLNNIPKDNALQKTISNNNNDNINMNKNNSSNLLLTALNYIQNQNNNKEITIQVCKICNQPNDLIQCQKCKKNFHLKCLNLNESSVNILCSNCKQKPKIPFKVSENIKPILEENKKNKKEKNEKKKIFKSTNSNLGTKRKREKIQNKSKKNNSNPNPNNIERRQSNNIRNNNNNNSNTNNDNIQINNINLKENKKRKGNKSNPRENYLLLNIFHSNPQYKRRKIRIGVNRQCNIYEYTDKYEKEINFDEEEYERNQLKQVWSVSKNPFSKEEIDKYLKTARLFWNYRNLNLENELCADYYEECEKIMKKKNISDKLKKKILKLMKELKELVRRGIDLNCHYDEMSLKMLYLCNYKMKVALFFLYKQLNPFIEEVEEGFKSDVLIFQNELFSMINDGDFYDPDD
jgi:hypothetical protein